MELKAVKEYEEPKYQTKEDNKKGILRFILNGGKFSLSVAIMCLLMNGNAMGSLLEGLNRWEGDLPYRYRVSVYEHGFSYVIKGSIIAGVLLIPIIIRLIMNNKTIKIASDEEERKRLKKKRNKELCIELGVLVIILVLAFIVGCIEYNMLYC